MPRLVRICLKRVLIDAIIVSVCVVFFVILRDLRVSEKTHPKTSSAPSPILPITAENTTSLKTHDIEANTLLNDKIGNTNQ